MTLMLMIALSLQAEDWPEWRGKGRAGVWNETGIVDRFPAGGLKIKWRTPIRNGWTGPSVAAGRVFVTDFHFQEGRKGMERALALDEKTGRILWTREWPADYTRLLQTWATGPRATPTVDGDRVYVLGATGMLACLNVRTGEVIWQRDFVKDFATNLPGWGLTGAPLVDGPRLICLVGGENNAKVAAFDKMTGKEIWRALPSDSEPGYNPPFLIEAGGRKQLIIWHPVAVHSLSPETGEVYWHQPFKINAALTVATPVFSANRLLFSSFYNGSLMMELDREKPAARLLWKGSSDSEIQTDGLHSLVSTPVIDGDYIYGICSYGQTRGLDAKTGKRLWETLEVTGEHARWSTGHIVRNGARYFINNDHGELIIGRFTPEGFVEISRTKLIKPTSKPGNRRELTNVNWTHPAYANRHIFTRNDEELICASLEQ
ncbi:MAG: PQQ-binding-like beta-propeller repeat protein [Bryobacteraceae bacterium]|nr:PQQ-binding-like beta-propeller repeat protein [Bryobacteraceae bacterium]